MDFSANIVALGNLTLFQLIILWVFALVWLYIWVDRRDTAQINNAVNHKREDEPTLREAVMQIRANMSTFIATTEQHLAFIDNRVDAVEKKVYKK
jgi:hypothetical protein